MSVAQAAELHDLAPILVTLLFRCREILRSSCMAVIDHLVYAVPDLAASVDWFEGATGVRPAIGGSHDAMGTHNALVSLGECYLELIAPDPDQPDPPTSGLPRPFGLDEVLAADGPALVGFAVRPDDDETIDEVADRMADAGHDPGEVVGMSRSTPDGVLLAWRLTLPTDRTIPFVIDWGETPRPNSTQPGGLELADFVVVHPQPFDLVGLVSALGLDLTVNATETPDQGPGLRATIVGPDGVVDL